MSDDRSDRISRDVQKSIHGIDKKKREKLIDHLVITLNEATKLKKKVKYF